VAGTILFVAVDAPFYFHCGSLDFYSVVHSNSQEEAK